MKTIIKGTTVTVRWAFIRPNGTPFPLANYDYELSYYTGRGRSKIEGTATIGGSGNVLIWTFSGDQQAYDGVYGLNLHLYLNHVHIATFDNKDVFELRRYAPGAIDVPVTVEVFTTYDGGSEEVRNIAQQALAKSIVITPMLYEGTQIATITKNDGTVIPLFAPLGGAGSVRGISLNGIVYDTPDQQGIINVNTRFLENPAGGKIGYYLKKTSDGVEWAPVSAVGAGQNLTIGSKVYNGSTPVTIAKADLTQMLSGEYMSLRANNFILSPTWEIRGVENETVFKYTDDSTIIGSPGSRLRVEARQLFIALDQGAVNGIYVDGMLLPKPTEDGTFLKYTNRGFSWTAEMADTWRHISVNGSQKYGNTPNANEGLNFAAGDGIQLTFSQETGTLTISNTGGGGGGTGTTVEWGEETEGSVPLSVGGASKTLALASHGHSQYALGSDLEDYLPLSGGTLTGTLTARDIIPVGGSELGDESNKWDAIYTNKLISYGWLELPAASASYAFFDQTFIEGHSYVALQCEMDDDDANITALKLGDDIHFDSVDTKVYGKTISLFTLFGQESHASIEIEGRSVTVNGQLNLSGYDIADVDTLNSIGVETTYIEISSGSIAFFDEDYETTVYLRYDAAHRAVYVEGADGESVNFYATGDITAGGINGNGLVARIAALESALAGIPVFEYDSEGHVLTMTSRT